MQGKQLTTRHNSLLDIWQLLTKLSFFFQVESVEQALQELEAILKFPLQGNTNSHILYTYMDDLAINTILFNVNNSI